MRCAITGAEGFIGRALVPELRRRGHDVQGWSRNSRFDLESALVDPQPPVAWIDNLRNTDVVIHLAGLAHQLQRDQDEQRYFRINRDGTLRLAAAAKAAGVRRFIFVSTAKVFGDDGGPYSRDSAPQPPDAYAQSKWEAELGLLALTKDSPLELVIIRPPLVYGAAAKANFARLLRLSRLPLPLPFARITNRRSMIGIDNLVDFIAHCIKAPAAANAIWTCTDREPYSLTQVIRAMRRADNRPNWQFGLPHTLLTAVIKPMLGQAATMRLFDNFEIDSRHTESELGWTAPFNMVEVLRRGGKS